MSLKDVKEIVAKDFERIGAFKDNKDFQFVQLDKERRQSIGWMDIQQPKKDDDTDGGLSGLIIPSKISEQRVFNAAECRQDGRLPTLAYINQKTGFQIWRSSELRQKTMGTDQALDDVALLEEIQKQSDYLVVYSAREATTGSTERNYGYESRQFYKKIDKQYFALSSKVKIVRAFE